MSKSFFVFLLFFLLLLFPLTTAVGVSPPKAYLDYTAGETIEFEYRIINNFGSPVQIEMSAFDSPLAEYVTFSKDSFTLVGSSEFVTAKVYLPPFEDITTYGDQYIRIRANEAPPNNGLGTVSAVTSVQTWILVHVPVPGQYGEVDGITVDNVNEHQDTLLKFEVKNRGSEDMSAKRAKVTVSDYDGNVIDTFTFVNINIDVEDGIELTQVIPSATYDPGKYTITADFFYNEQKPPHSKSTTFFVGTTDVQVLDYTKDLQEGQINKVRVSLQSLWGSDLTSIRAAIIDFDNHSQAMPVIDLGPFEKRIVETYIDVPLLNGSPFFINTSLQNNATVKTIMTLRFPVDASNDVDKDLELTFTIHANPEPVNEKKSIELSTTTLLVAGLVLVVIILIVMVVILLPKGKNGETNKSKKK